VEILKIKTEALRTLSVKSGIDLHDARISLVYPTTEHRTISHAVGEVRFAASDRHESRDVLEVVANDLFSVFRVVGGFRRIRRLSQSRICFNEPVR